MCRRGTSLAPLAGNSMQSALDPAGREAAQIAQLFDVMSWGTGIIWLGVMALVWYALRAHQQSHRTSLTLIFGGGVVFPVVVLIALMTGGLSALPGILAPASNEALSLEIAGSQWWWRVTYLREGQPPIELANEIRLPVHRRTNTRLVSADVIHSFWVPPLNGKLDMIPGRVNRLALQPTRTGLFRGACAEFCGTSHALMNLMVVVMEPAAFDQWLAAQAQPAQPPADPLAERGRVAFHQHGCDTCHTIRGAGAFGRNGPDLTHVGSRLTLAAGRLPSSPEHFQQWISSTEILKPGAQMPAYATLPSGTLAALAAYLSQLQ